MWSVDTWCVRSIRVVYSVKISLMECREQTPTILSIFFNKKKTGRILIGEKESGREGAHNSTTFQLRNHQTQTKIRIIKKKLIAAYPLINTSIIHSST